MKIVRRIIEKLRLILLELVGLTIIANEWYMRNVIYKRDGRPAVVNGYGYRTVDYLLDRAEGMTILDVGSHIGLTDYEFVRRGAKLIHGIDKSFFAIGFARTLFRYIPCESKFIHADLTKRIPDIGTYDIVLFMSIYHWLKQKMSEEDLRELVRTFARKAKRWFVRAGDFPRYCEEIDSILHSEGFTVRLKNEDVCIFERGSAQE